jgi:hypothetical protein
MLRFNNLIQNGHTVPSKKRLGKNNKKLEIKTPYRMSFSWISEGKVRPASQKVEVVQIPAAAHKE